MGRGQSGPPAYAGRRLHRRSIRFLCWHLPACAAVDVPRRHRVAVSIAQGAAAHVAPESHLFSLVRIVGSASPPIPLACQKKLRRGLHVSSDDARAFAPVPLGDAAPQQRRPGRRLDVLGRTHLSRKQWIANEEYSHGFLIPLVAFYLLWLNRLALQRLDFRGSWIGVTVV